MCVASNAPSTQPPTASAPAAPSPISQPQPSQPAGAQAASARRGRQQVRASTVLTSPRGVTDQGNGANPLAGKTLLGS